MDDNLKNRYKNRRYSQSGDYSNNYDSRNSQSTNKRYNIAPAPVSEQQPELHSPELIENSPTTTYIASNNSNYQKTVHDSAYKQVIHKPKRSIFRKIYVFGSMAVIFIAIASFGTWYLYFQNGTNQNPLPQTIAQAFSFNPYYPSVLPKGFTYKQGSAQNQNGYLIYKIVNSKKTITFTEQSAPSGPVDLRAFPGYQYVKSSVGQAGLGTSIGSPSGIVVTNSAIVYIMSNNGVTATTVKSVIENLVAEPTQTSTNP